MEYTCDASIGINCFFENKRSIGNQLCHWIKSYTTQNVQFVESNFLAGWIKSKIPSCMQIYDNVKLAFLMLFIWLFMWFSQHNFIPKTEFFFRQIWKKTNFHKHDEIKRIIKISLHLTILNFQRHNFDLR